MTKEKKSFLATTWKEFQDTATFDGAGYGFGRTWHTSRTMCAWLDVRKKQPKYMILVRGKAIGNDYTICESFPWTKEGFEEAKKFALKSK